MKLLHLSLIAVAFTAAASLSFSAPSKPSKPKEKPGIAAYNEGTEQIAALKFAEAEKSLRKALKEVPKMPEAHNNLAYALRKQGEDQFEEALEHYDRAIELNPELPEPYMYRGVLYVQMEQKEDALKDHAVLLDLSPSLASELEYVIENDKEKEPEQFFGVTDKK